MIVNERLGKTSRHQYAIVSGNNARRGRRCSFGLYAPATHGVYEAELQMPRDPARAPKAWGGPSSVANVIFPNVLDATSANRAFYPVTESSEAPPGPLDQPCYAGQPDLFPGAFRF